MREPAGAHASRLLVALGATAALACAGCGAGGGNPLRSVVTAASRTLSLSVVSNLTLSGSGIARASEPLLGQGEFLFVSGLGYEAVDLPAATALPAGREFLVYLPTHLYLEPPTARQALPPGRSWLVATLTGSGGAADEETARLVRRLEAADPELLLDEIDWAATHATALGTRVVAHVPLAEYAVSVDLERARTAAKARGDGAIAAALGAELARGDTATVDAWVDAAGRVEMLAATLPEAAPLRVEFALSAFGTDISATPNLPLPAELVGLDALAPARRDSALAPWVTSGA